MNIYKNIITNEILCSNNGCPDKWEVLGFDSSVNDLNKKYVIGFSSGKATFSSKYISDAKDLAISKLWNNWNIKKYDDYIFNNNIYQADVKSFERMSFTIAAINAGKASVDWKDKSNNKITLSASDFKSLFIGIVDRGETLYWAMQTKISALNALSDINSINSFDTSL